MRLGIDASNIRTGGGLTHLAELLIVADPLFAGIKRIIIWSNKNTLAQLPERSWLEKKREQAIENNIACRLLWQRYKLKTLAAKSCDLLFVPGGLYLGGYRPFVTMSQNLLPFDQKERARYGVSWERLRLTLLSKGQTTTFRNAAGVIFLSNAARQIVESQTGYLKQGTVIPHGISEVFRKKPRQQLPLSSFSAERPFRWLYVSIIDVYKHQVNVAEAITELRRKGTPVAIDMVGPAYPAALENLKRALCKLDPRGEAVRYLGPVSHRLLAPHYFQSNGFVFASSCENLPIILLEAMAAGLPIACSNRGPMPETLKDAGVYFDPEMPEQIADAMLFIMENKACRSECSERAYEYALEYTWPRCAEKTFSFLAEVAKR